MQIKIQERSTNEIQKQRNQKNIRNKKEDTAQEKTEQKYEKEDYAEYLEHKLELLLGRLKECVHQETESTGGN